MLSYASGKGVSRATQLSRGPQNTGPEGPAGRKIPKRCGPLAAESYHNIV